MFRLFFFFMSIGIIILWWSPNLHYIKGVIWQPTLNYTTPKGAWEQLGANSLLVQWSVLEEKAWIEGTQFPLWKPTPQWSSIISQPWAEKIVLGLSGDFNLTKARGEWQYHKEKSLEIFSQIKENSFIKQVDGWYAPVEVDPSWKDTKEIKKYLEELPHPLYVSSFVGRYNNPYKYAQWVKSWLPRESILLFQDSVGTKGITQKESLEYIRALKEVVGKENVVVILEAFKIRDDKKIISTSIVSIANRLINYKKLELPIYIFSCRYIDRIDILLLKGYLLLLSSDES